jgi:hypothetical protein
MEVREAPDGPGFEGMTLRLFDPSLDTWSIFWSSTRAPGTLDPAVVGRFEGDLGTFTGAEVIGGRRVLIRFSWSRGETPRWQQGFSYDAGATWSVNWTMDFTRA